MVIVPSVNENQNILHNPGLKNPSTAVLFDLDGTLIDSLDVFYLALNEILKHVGLPPVSKKEVIDVMRSNLSPWDAFIPAKLPDRDGIINRCRAFDKEIFPVIYRQEARLFPASRETLYLLSQKGIKMGVVTSGFQEDNEIGQFFQDQGINSYVGATVMRFDAPRPKPAPDPIILCLERLEADPVSSVFIGDSPDDIRAGKAAGTMTIGVLSGVGTFKDLSPLNPDWIIQGVADLPNILFPDTVNLS